MAVKQQKVGKYRILSPLKEGGMGSLFLARHPTLKQNVVLKKLTLRGKELRERFQREARILMELRHENIVTVYDHFREGRSYYIVFELVEGQSLEEYLQNRGLFKPVTAGKIINRVASALAYIHSKGIIHRDIKPANILLSAEGHVKLADFGIAGLEEQDALDEGDPKIMGTPAYMSPEQLAGSRFAGTASDIFSLGITFIQLLTGETPAGAADELEEVRRLYSGSRLKRHDLLKGLPFSSLIRSMIRIKERQRPSARAVAQRLQPLIDRQEGSFFKRWRKTLIPVAISVVLFFILFIFKTPLLNALHPSWLVPFRISVQSEQDSSELSVPRLYMGKAHNLRLAQLRLGQHSAGEWQTPFLFRRSGEYSIIVDWGSSRYHYSILLDDASSESPPVYHLLVSPGENLPLNLKVLLLNGSTGEPLTGSVEIFDDNAEQWRPFFQYREKLQRGRDYRLRCGSPGFISREVLWRSEDYQDQGRLVVFLFNEKP